MKGFVKYTKNIHAGKNDYLVLWDGYPKEEASWVSAVNITSAAIR